MSTNVYSNVYTRSQRQRTRHRGARLAAVLAARRQLRVHPRAVAVLDEQVGALPVAVAIDCAADDVRRVGQMLHDLCEWTARNAR